MNTVNDFDSLSYAEKLADEIASIQWKIDTDDPANRADWWFSVMTNLSTLLKRYYKKLDSIPPSQRPGIKPSEIQDDVRAAKPKADTVPGAPWKTQPLPWKCGNPKRPTTSDILLDTVHEQECHSHRIDALQEQIDRLTRRIDALESRFGRMDFYCGTHSDEHSEISARLDALESKTPR